jgi:hypothetical protein
MILNMDCPYEAFFCGVLRSWYVLSRHYFSHFLKYNPAWWSFQKTKCCELSNEDYLLNFENTVFSGFSLDCWAGTKVVTSFLQKKIPCVCAQI